MIRRPRVVVLITGDELLAPGTPARGFQIPDMNSVMIAALVVRDGGSCEIVGPLPDRRATILDAILEVQTRADLVLISGGSSAGPEDHVPGIIAEPRPLDRAWRRPSAGQSHRSRPDPKR